MVNVLLNDCIIIENNITKIDIINESLNKSNNNINSEIKYNSEQELKELLNIIKTFVKLTSLPVITEKFNISQNPMIISPNNNLTQQKVTMDPYPIMKNENKIYHIISNGNWSSIRIYNKFESFKNQNYDELKLPVNGYGAY